jgi:hypothetical protein
MINYLQHANTPAASSFTIKIYLVKHKLMNDSASRDKFATSTCVNLSSLLDDKGKKVVQEWFYRQKIIQKKRNNKKNILEKFEMNLESIKHFV